MCIAQGLATGTTLALVLERGLENPLRGGLQDPGGGVGLAERWEDWTVVIRRSGRMIFHILPTSIDVCHLSASSACREGNASGPVFQKSSGDSCSFYI